MPGSKNIRIFKGWFGLDKKSQSKEVEICSKAKDKVEQEVKWTSDFTSFWVRDKSNYYNVSCEKCDKSYDFPIDHEACIVCGSKTDTLLKRVGKTDGVGENAEVGKYHDSYLKASQQDLVNNPVQEEGFDWKHLQENL